MNIYVSPTLDLDQHIYRPISFYGLVELMTFGRLSFTQYARVRLSSLRYPTRRKIMADDTSAADTVGVQNQRDTDVPIALSTVAYQSWGMFDEEHFIDWTYDDASAPSIHLISTVRALAESLLVSEDWEVFIDRSARFTSAPLPLHSAHSKVVPIFDDGTLTVIAWPRDCATGFDQNLALRLPLNLNALLTGVLLSPKAPSPFVELVSSLVQRITHAPVSRASWSTDPAKVGAVYASSA